MQTPVEHERQSGNEIADGLLAFKDLDRQTQQVLNAIPQHVFVSDASGDLLYANQMALDYYGVALECSRSEDFRARFCHPEDMAAMTEGRNRSLAHGLPLELKARLLGKDGRYRWFLVRSNPLRDEEGSVIRWFGTQTDIQDPMLAEDRLRLVLNTTPALLHTARPDGCVDFLNQGWLDYLGLRMEEAC